MLYPKFCTLGVLHILNNIYFADNVQCIPDSYPVRLVASSRDLLSRDRDVCLIRLTDNTVNWRLAVLIFLCAYVCVCVCMYVYIYIHTHTHTKYT